MNLCAFMIKIQSHFNHKFDLKNTKYSRTLQVFFSTARSCLFRPAEALLDLYFHPNVDLKHTKKENM